MIIITFRPLGPSFRFTVYLDYSLLTLSLLAIMVRCRPCSCCSTLSCNEWQVAEKTGGTARL